MLLATVQATQPSLGWGSVESLMDRTNWPIVVPQSAGVTAEC
jgi:hypothetical protein